MTRSALRSGDSRPPEFLASQTTTNPGCHRQKRQINMQAIITKFIPPTNTRPARYKATCERGSLTLSANYKLDANENHRAVCDALCAQFDAKDFAEYGIGASRSKHTWSRPKAGGQIPSGEFVFCFIPDRFFERAGTKGKI